MEPTTIQYQVIARKYRPQTFANILGQEAIVTTLKNALKNNRLAHAYLFCGCRGTGKTTLARVFAKALNCSQLTPEWEPCNTCPSCVDIALGRSLDVMEIDGASNRGIDDIRQINETIGYAPTSGKHKIYIIDEVHMLTKEAFNALLKTLEEPPPSVKFFFATTEPHKVLPTIISRCQRFDLNRIPFETLKKKLAWIAQDLNVDCDDEVCAIVANLGEGSLRDAESIFDQIICYAEQPITAAKVLATLGILPRSAFFSLDQAFNEQNLSYAFELADEIFASGKDLSYFIDNLIEHYRCLLKLKLNAPVLLPTARLNEQYATSLPFYTQEQCLYILDFLIHWQQQIGKTPFKRVSLEMILLHIIRSKYRLTLPSLVKRLHELEQKTPGLPATKAEPQQTLSPPVEMIKVELPQPPQEKIVIQTTGLLTQEMDTHESEVMVLEEKVEPQPATLPRDSLSIEDSLMKKIREKIDSLPLQVETAVVEETPPLPKPSSLLFSKSKWEAVATDEPLQTATLSPPPIHKTETPPSPQPPVAQQPLAPPPLSIAAQSRYDTLMRFAAVELEGILKKEQTHG